MYLPSYVFCGGFRRYPISYDYAKSFAQGETCNYLKTESMIISPLWMVYEKPGFFDQSFFFAKKRLSR